MRNKGAIVEEAPRPLSSSLLVDAAPHSSKSLLLLPTGPRDREGLKVDRGGEMQLRSGSIGGGFMWKCGGEERAEGRWWLHRSCVAEPKASMGAVQVGNETLSISIHRLARRSGGLLQPN